MNKAIAITALRVLLDPATAQETRAVTAQVPRLDFAVQIRAEPVLLKRAKKNPRGGSMKVKIASRWRVSLRPGAISLLDLRTLVETVVDRKQQLLIFIDHGKKRVRTRSLLGWIAALDQERAKQLKIVKTRRSTDDQDLEDSFATFCLESWFRFGQDAANELKYTKRDSRLSCSRGNETVLKATLGGPKLPKTLRSEFELFLIRMFHIHPAICAQLVALDAVPKRIIYRTYNGDWRTDTRVQFSSWPPKGHTPPDTQAPVKAVATYSAWIDPEDPLDKLLDDITAKRIGAKPPSRAEYAALVKQLAKTGHHMDAFLVLLESNFAYANVPVRAQLRDVDLQSEDAAPLKRVMKPGKNDSQNAAAEKAIREIPRDGLHGVAILDILRANRLSHLKRYADAELLFLAVLRKKPWLVGPFMDLGKIYAERGAMHQTWRCGQRAYDISPKHPQSRDFVKLRDELRKRYASWL